MEDGVKISELTTTTTISDSDLIPIVQSNETKAITKENFESSLKPITLYSNPDGNNGTITLNDDVNNYEYIEIFYRTNDGYLGSKKIISGNYYTELVSYQSNKSTDPEAYIKIRVISINNNTISTRQDSGGYYIKELMLSAGGIIKYENNYIYITRVIGYK